MGTGGELEDIEERRKCGWTRDSERAKVFSYHAVHFCNMDTHGPTQVCNHPFMIPTTSTALLPNKSFKKQ